MKQYKLYFSTTSTAVDRYLMDEFGIWYGLRDEDDSANLNGRYVLLDEEQAVLLRLKFTNVKLTEAHEV